MNIEELGDLSEQARASLKVAAPVEKLELKCTGHEPFVCCGIEYKQGEVLVQFCKNWWYHNWRFLCAILVNTLKEGCH